MGGQYGVDAAFFKDRDQRPDEFVGRRRFGVVVDQIAVQQRDAPGLLRPGEVVGEPRGLFMEKAGDETVQFFPLGVQDSEMHGPVIEGVIIAVVLRAAVRRRREKAEESGGRHVFPVEGVALVVAHYRGEGPRAEGGVRCGLPALPVVKAFSVVHEVAEVHP